MSIILPAKVVAGKVTPVTRHVSQWDKNVTLDCECSAEEITFNSSYKVHCAYGTSVSEVSVTLVSPTEITAKLPDWIWEAAGKAELYLYDGSSSVAGLTVTIDGRSALPVSETVDGLALSVHTINLVPGSDATIRVSQFDKDSRTLRFRIKNGQTYFSIPSGTAAQLKIKKPDGFVVVQNCTIANNYVYVTLTEQATAVSGKSVAEITLVKNSKLIGTANFYLDVEVSPTEGGVISDSQIPDVQQILDAFALMPGYASGAESAADTASAAATTATNAATIATNAANTATSAAESAEEYADIAAEAANSGNMTAYLDTNGALHFAAVIETA